MKHTTCTVVLPPSPSPAHGNSLKTCADDLIKFGTTVSTAEPLLGKPDSPNTHPQSIADYHNYHCSISLGTYVCTLYLLYMHMNMLYICTCPCVNVHVQCVCVCACVCTGLILHRCHLLGCASTHTCTCSRAHCSFFLHNAGFQTCSCTVAVLSCLWLNLVEITKR